MTATVQPTTPSPRPGRAPELAAPRRLPLARVGLHRARYELKTFLRAKEAVVFNLAFPVMLLLLFGSMFTGEIAGTGVAFRQVLVSGVLASGLMTVSFQGLAIGVAIDRDEGTIKRLVGLPVPRSAYFLGKVGLVGVLGFVEIGLVLAIGASFMGLELPADPVKWLTFVAVFVLGITACSLFGIAYSRLAPNGKNASAVVAPPFIALQFISGVWVQFSDLPGPLRQVASLFPLRWMVQGFQSVFLPDSFAGATLGGSWDLPRVFMVLIAWVVGGFVLCRMTFRWTGETR